MTIYLRTDLAKRLKVLSITERKHAYLLIEEMIESSLGPE
ncbi:conserved hypothetical protein [Ahrensia sp. R2A130]|nr:conserved hypothetical protein [Ahrensia sp. R2A130]